MFCSDNEAVVHMLNSRTSRTPPLMQLFCSLLLSAARYSFSFSSRLLFLLFAQAPCQPLRHQFPSSYIGDEFNI